MLEQTRIIAVLGIFGKRMIGGTQGVSRVVPIAVVGRFVIVGDADERVLLHRSLQVLVAADGSINESIVFQSQGNQPARGQHHGPVCKGQALEAGIARGLVDEVAEVDDEVEVLFGHVGVGGEQALFPVLAAREREPQPLGPLIRGRERAGAADRAGRGAGAESIPVPAIRLQAVALDVHRMAEFGGGLHRAVPDDGAHRVVAGDFPTDVDRCFAHATVRARWLRAQPRPQHDAVVARLPGGRAELERVGAEVVRARAVAWSELRHQWQAQEASAGAEELAAVRWSGGAVHAAMQRAACQRTVSVAVKSRCGGGSGRGGRGLRGGRWRCLVMG